MSTTTQDCPLRKIMFFLLLLLHVSGAAHVLTIAPRIYFVCIWTKATACYGNDDTELPSSNLFGSAGEVIWDNGAACGRQYLVRCISAVVPETSVPGVTIQIKIVDRASSSASTSSRAGVTMVLSDTAFAAIANQTANYINVEFQQDKHVGLSPLNTNSSTRG